MPVNKTRKFVPNKKFKSAAAPKENVTMEKLSVWARAKAWASRSWIRAKAWITKTASAVKASPSFKATRNVGRTFMTKLNYVLPSIRSMLRGFISVLGLSLWLTSFMVAPVVTLFLTFAVSGAFYVAAAIVGELDKSPSKAASIVLDVVDVIGKAVVIGAEVLMAVVIGSTLGVLNPISAAICGLMICGWIYIDAAQREVVRIAVAKKTATTDEVPDVATVSGTKEYDPFGKASNIRSAEINR